MKSLCYIEACESTNDEILDFPELSNLEIFGVYTFNQIRGRGQYGNSWQMPKNQNLAYTLAIRKNSIKIPNNLFNFHTASILRKFIANLTSFNVEIKWPNDIIIKNKKISGILLESKKLFNEDFFVVGMGINVLQTDFRELPNAGSIFTQTQQHYHLTEFCESLHRFFLENVLIQISNNEILAEFNQHLFRKDVISVFKIQGIRQNGIIRFVDEDGFLHVSLEKDGDKKFFHKEVELLY